MTRCPWACYLSCSQCVHQCERWVESEKKWLYACVCEWHMLYEVLRVLKQRKTAQRRIGPFTPINGCAENYFVKGGIMALRWDTARFCYSTSQTLKKTKLFCAMFSSHSSNSSTARRSSKERNDFILETWAWRNCQCIGSLTEKSECLLYFWSLFGIFGKSSSSSVYS